MDMSSDCESIKTEDFAVKFTEIVNTECKDSGFSGKSDRNLTPALTNDDDNEQNIPPLDICGTDEGIGSQCNASSTSKLNKSSHFSTITHSKVPTINNNTTPRNDRDTTSKPTYPRPVLKYKSVDLESIATEYFEEQFRTIFNKTPNNNNSNSNNDNHNGSVSQTSGRSLPAESCTTTSINIDMGNLLNVQPIRRDILNKFLTKYTMDNTQTENPIRNETSKTPTHQPIIKHHPIHSTNNLTGPSTAQRSIMFQPQNTNENTRSHSPLYKNRSELTEQIRTKSLKIQEEIHEERKRKHDTNAVNPNEMLFSQTTPITPRDTLDMKVRELDQLTDRMKRARCDREKITQELTNLRRQNQSTLQTKPQLKPNLQILPSSKLTTVVHTDTVQAATKDKTSHPNDRRFATPLYKDKSNHDKDIQLELNLNQKLAEKKHHLRELEMKIFERLEEIRNLEAVGLNKDEIQKVIEERNELYEILRQNEENSQNQYELKKELSHTREDLKNEQCRLSQQIFDLENELNISYKKNNGLFEEKEEIIRDNETLTETLRSREDEIEKLYLERNELRSLIDRCREEIDLERKSSQEMLDRERKRMESHNETVECQNKLQLTDLQNKCSQNQIQIKNYQDSINQLKESSSKLEKEKEQINKSLKEQESLHREAIQKVKDEYNGTFEKLKKDFYTNKEHEIQSLKIEYDTEQMKTINNLRECFKQQILDLQARLESKSQDHQDLRNELRKLKHEYNEKEDEMRAANENNLTQIRKEQQRIIDGMERNKTRDMDELKEHFDDLTKKLRSELEKERALNESMRVALDKANKDLSKEAEATKRQKHEKNTSLQKLKEIAKDKFQQEAQKIRQHYESELEDQLRSMENLMEEKVKDLNQRNGELETSESKREELERLLDEISNQFVVMSKELCVDMAKKGKFVAPNFSGIKFEPNMDGSVFLGKLKKNLQLCNREFQQYYQETLNKIKSENEASVKRLEDKNQADFDAIKEQILKDHADEVNTLKYNQMKEIENVQRNHEHNIAKVKSNIRDWKAKTAEKLAHKLNKEFRKEIERKTSARESKTSRSCSLYSARQQSSEIPSFNSAATPTNPPKNPIGLIEDLRGNIRQLRDENISLRKLLVENPNNNAQKLSHLTDKNGHKISNGSLDNGYHDNNHPKQHHGSYKTLELYNGHGNDKIVPNSRPQSACQDNFHGQPRSASRNNESLISGNVGRSNSFKYYQN